MRSLQLLAAALAVAAAPARAQSDSAIEDAKRYAAEAKVHYDLGEYEAAAEAYQRVYRIKPLPALLYNIAQSYRQAGLYDKAKRFYTTFLREAKDGNAPLVADARRALREVEELLAKEKKTRESPPTGVAQTPAALTPPPSAVGASTAAAAAASALRPAVTPPGASASATARGLGPDMAPAADSLRSSSAVPLQVVSPHAVRTGPNRTYAYVSAGAAAVFLGAGAMFAIRAAKFDNELTARPHPQTTIDDLMSSSKSSHLLCGLLLGAGAAAGIGAGVLYLWPTGDGVAVQGRF